MLSFSSVNLDPSKETAHGVLLLHAFPLSSRMWARQLSMLEKLQVTALAPNIPGVEGSPEKNGWTFSDYAGSIAELLRVLTIRKVTVVGLSMGGYQAFELWRAHPESIASLVLCDTRAEQDNEGALANRRDFISAVKANGPGEAIERMLPNVFAKATYLEQVSVIDTFKTIVGQQSGTVIAAAMEAIASRIDSVDILPEISCPVTFIFGEDDKLTPKTLGESMSSRIPRSRLCLVPGGGHLCNMEQPDIFNECLLGHLRDVMPGVGSGLESPDDIEEIRE
ncbi:alpha/beta hydrolase [Prosthecochloris sp. GSB1]|uniref:alpha/beta fold hydrolase n=1 Tax=Prosthecochloris sp. GSB1 TaxID=281093 RepID=UPI000B8CEB1C|nr:alpha/beta hydrolase [Prosthecochloris sp. GSB1]ASQ91252.1 alpha/beta hydrolase [Prosthecochloris sp. GSB1]